MSHSPFFSVVLATYSRGQLIRPTIESVLQQTFADFELMVVGDGCNDDTEQVVRAFRSDKISWRNLAQNSESQSFPNNEGTRCSRGAWVAYIGHDDVWAPNHLARLRDLIEADADLDFVVAGCVYYGPEGSEAYYVTGLFEQSDAAFQNFFPPSSIAHRRDVIDRIGDWRDPRSVRAPVDCDFSIRAAHAGLRFRSTGRVTVHKFAAGHRFLSYLRPSAQEQLAMLRSFDGGGPHVADLIETSKRQGMFMIMRHADFSQYENGQLFDARRKSVGLRLPPLRPLPGRIVIEQTDDPRALDWYGLERNSRPYRWSGPNPHPRILIPFTGDAAKIALRLHALPSTDLSVSVEGHKVDHVIETGAGGTRLIVFTAQLSQSDYTVLTLHTPMHCPHDISGNGDIRRLGIAVSDIVVEPLSWRDRVAEWIGRHRRG